MRPRAGKPATCSMIASAPHSSSPGFRRRRRSRHRIAIVEAAIKHYSPVELVHLITVCAMASMVQRFSAIAKPTVEEEVMAFLDHNRIPLDTLANKYPLAAERTVQNLVA